jgi:phosphohistidine phosphatase
MKRLILIRHAKTEQLTGPGLDFDRVLTERGHTDSVLMANQLIKASNYPDLIISSTAIRAKQTAEIFAENLKYKKENIVLKKFLYHDFYDKKEILKVINKIEDKCNIVFIIGHNPYISELASQMTGDVYEHIPTAGYLSILFNTNNWSDISLGSGTLEVFDYPSGHK